MDDLLSKQDKRVVGTKQVLRALTTGQAAKVYLGKDADSFLYHRVHNLCEEKGVPVTVVDTMQELGKLCKLDVKAATAAVIK